MSIIHLTQENYDKTMQAGLPVLIDFWAVWCMPCTMFSPIIEEAAQKLEGRAIVAKVNIDEQPALAQRFGVMSIPTAVVVKDGKEVNRSVGLVPLENVLALIE
ncbi:MAG: thioredoxin [Butyricicoccus pullicaecorum]|nr:thioredoxin [Butyricicoccus pullicaecorum]